MENETLSLTHSIAYKSCFSCYCHFLRVDVFRELLVLGSTYYYHVFPHNKLLLEYINHNICKYVCVCVCVCCAQCSIHVATTLFYCDLFPSPYPPLILCQLNYVPHVTVGNQAPPHHPHWHFFVYHDLL